ncbi:Muscle LIM protein Mlp84B [Bulinus truncatus]|nr:Muscle LIM protein Mlp84B [Bulinus truncatus]
MPPVLGGADKCPKCNKNVYFAEEVRALGRKYHKQCLKCSQCGKFLDSTNCNDHDDDIFCNTCYRRNFGPNSAAPATAPDTDAVKAPLSSDSCQRCGKAVYMAERCTGGGKYFHKRCFRCNACGVSLDSTRLSVREDEIYCKSCYAKNFGPKGYGFAGGASGLSMDTGKPDDIPTSHIPSLAQAHTAPLLSEGGEDGDENDDRDRCNRCRKVVYFAERVSGIGKVFHKICFKCMNCNKLLDSTTVTEHAGQAYCKACYGKNFGPKGYGFAGGASGLSMDTGKLDEIPTSNIPALAQALSAPLMSEGDDQGDGGWGDDKERCNRCHKVVYFAERVTGIGKVFHKICFKCTNCNKSLDSTTVTEHGGQVYCKACYTRNFGPKGFGFGISMNKKQEQHSKFFEVHIVQLLLFLIPAKINAIDYFTSNLFFLN